MAYNPNIHHRKSIRLKGYDYSQAGLYFITICTQNRACLFGEIVGGQMVLNVFGEIAIDEWEKTEKIRENCRIYESIIMPNHIHGIIEITHKQGSEREIGKFESPSQTIGAIIRGFKIATIKRIKEHLLKNREEIAPAQRTGELQFAPTEFAPTEFASAEKIKALDFKIWQRNYWEHIIRNYNEYQRISQYIINNPQQWENDKLK